MKVYKPQLNFKLLDEPFIDPVTMQEVEFNLPLEVNLQRTFFDLPPRNMLQRLWGRVGIMYKGLTRTNGRRQKLQEQKSQHQEQDQEKQQLGNKNDSMEVEQTTSPSIYDAKTIDSVTNNNNNNGDNTQATQQTSPNQTPRMTTKRPYSSLEDDGTKSPLIDTTNHHDNTQQQHPSKKKLWKTATNSGTTPHKQVFLYNSSTSMEPAHFDSRTNNKNSTSINKNNSSNTDIKKSDNISSSDSSITLSPGDNIKKENDQGTKRKHLQLEDNNEGGDCNTDLVVPQKTADSTSSSSSTGDDSDNTRRSMKRKRTTLYMNWQTTATQWSAAATAESKNELDGQQFLVFNIPVVCFLVLFVFMFVLYTSYFGLHSRPYFPF